MNTTEEITRQARKTARELNAAGLGVAAHELGDAIGAHRKGKITAVRLTMAIGVAQERLEAHKLQALKNHAPAMLATLEAQLATQRKIIGYLNSYAKGDHMAQFSRVEPSAVLAQVYADLAAEFGELERVTEKAGK